MGLVERPGPFFCSSPQPQPQPQLSHGRTVQSYLLASGTYVLLRTQLSLGHAVGVPRLLKPSYGLAMPQPAAKTQPQLTKLWLAAKTQLQPSNAAPRIKAKKNTAVACRVVTY